MDYSVTQLARALDKSGNTIRNWAREFEEHMSDGANPPKGTPRQYTEEDVAVLETVAVLREQLVEYDDIARRLDAGERLEFQKKPGSVENQVKSPSESALVPESLAAVFRGQFDALQARVTELEELRLEAEKRATAAETELRILRELQAQEEGKGEEKRAPWWAFWRA